MKKLFFLLLGIIFLISFISSVNATINFDTSYNDFSNSSQGTLTTDGNFVYGTNGENGNGTLFQFDKTNINNLINSISLNGTIQSSPLIDGNYLYILVHYSDFANSVIYQINKNNISNIVSNFSVPGYINGNYDYGFVICYNYLYTSVRGGDIYRLNKFDVSQVLDNVSINNWGTNFDPICNNNKVYFPLVSFYSHNAAIYSLNATNLSQIFASNNIFTYNLIKDNSYIYTFNPDLYQIVKLDFDSLNVVDETPTAAGLISYGMLAYDNNKIFSTYPYGTFGSVLTFIFNSSNLSQQLANSTIGSNGLLPPIVYGSSVFIDGQSNYEGTTFLFELNSTDLSIISYKVDPQVYQSYPLISYPYLYIPNFYQYILSNIVLNNNSNQSIINPPPTSFFQSIGDYFASLFPPASSLSTTSKMSLVFITMLLVTLLIYFLAWKVAGISGIVHILVLIVDLALFFLFISLGYIPIGILIILVLVLIVATYFRFKSTGS